MISLGSNKGDRKEYLRNALQMLSQDPCSVLKKTSSLYETEPVGKRDQPYFLNATAAFSTENNAADYFNLLRRIENRLGRERGEKWGPRTIDLDVLLCGDMVLSTTDLRIPHPELLNRKFVIIPLLEIDPEAVHPISGKKIADRLQDPEIAEQKVEKVSKADWYA